MGNSIFWYDFEATGIDPRRDRPLQVAGVRTNEQLEEIDEPLCIDCRLAEDVLPHPMACLVTGIDPARVQRGLPEARFMHLLHEQMARPGTCTDRKSTRLNSSHVRISYAVFCLKKKKKKKK